MLNLKQKIVSVIASAVFLAIMITPASADISIDIKGNQRGSDNSVDLTMTNETKIEQDSTSVFTNIVSVANSTGNNTIKDAKGAASITSGNATANVAITNEGGSNEASTNQCGCPEGSIDIDISHNGRHSTNDVNADLQNKLNVQQTSWTDSYNSIYVYNKTGGNQIKDSWWGTHDLTSGHANTTIGVQNVGGSNSLNP